MSTPTETATHTPETFREQLSRVEQMADGDETWDLSDNDRAALKAVLADRLKSLTALRKFVDANRINIVVSVDETRAAWDQVLTVVREAEGK